MKINLPFSIFHFPLNFRVINLKIRKLATHWQLATANWKLSSGFTLLEILVVVAIFAILGILITRSIILSIAGSKKSESVVNVRDNLNYSLSVIERQLRNADAIPNCPNSDTTVLNYTDQNGNPASFSCSKFSDGTGFVASTSAAITGSDINVINCSFTCTPGTGVNPPVVTVSLEAQATNAVGVQSADVTLNSQIDLRNY